MAIRSYTLPSVVVLSTWLSCAFARADELYLAKNVIEGRIVKDAVYSVEIETPSGILAVPTHLITRRTTGPSRMERYETELGRRPLTTATHLELAVWCRSAGLPDKARHHVGAALEAEPQNPDALRAAGYVKVGDVWILASEPRDESTQNQDANALVDRLVKGWFPPIRSIRDRYLVEPVDAHGAALGRVRLGSIRAPLSIVAAVRVLGNGTTDARRALAEMLGVIPGDAATLNLIALALLDPSAEVRGFAATELTRLRDPRIVRLLRTALRCEVEGIVRRAAEALGRLGDGSAVEDLVSVLPATGVSGPPLGIGELFDQLAASFDQSVLIPTGERPVEHPPAIAFASFGRMLRNLQRDDSRPTGEMRSYVQDALIGITGENYGFDITAWSDWAAKHGARHRTSP